MVQGRSAGVALGLALPTAFAALQPLLYAALREDFDHDLVIGPPRCDVRCCNRRQPAITPHPDWSQAQ